jgi:hypothetical protein
MANDKTSHREGILSLQRYGTTFTAQWAVTGNRLTVYLGLDEESTMLDMFEKEPETLAKNRPLGISEAAAREAPTYTIAKALSAAPLCSPSAAVIGCPFC